MQRLSHAWDRFKLWLYTTLSYPTNDFDHVRIFYLGIPCVLKRNRFNVSTESDALKFLHSTGLGLRIPRLLDTLRVDDATWTLMSKIPGRRLFDCIQSEDISDSDLTTVIDDAAHVIEKLWTIRLADHPVLQQGMVMYSASGHGLPDSLDIDVMDIWGPVRLEQHLLDHAFENFCHDASTWSIETLQKAEHDRTQRFLQDEITWVHCDLRAMNMMVHNGRLSGVIDWENSGWMPRHWQLLVIRPFLDTQPFAAAKLWKAKRFDEDVELAYEASLELIQHYV